VYLLNTLCIKFLLTVITVFQKPTVEISTSLFVEK